MDVLNLCRLCGEKTGELSYSLFDKSKNGVQLLQIIKKYIPVLVYRTDPLTKRICNNCYDDLNKYFEFLQKCISVQEDFKTKLTNLTSDDMNDNVQLFLNSLENHKTDYLSSFYISYCKNTPTKDFSCQLSPDNFSTPKPVPQKRKFTILTPELINDSLNPPAKKRRGLAGPRCKTRPRTYRPLTLLQCTLNCINHQIDPYYEPRNYAIIYSGENNDSYYSYNESLYLNGSLVDRSVFNEALRLRDNQTWKKLMSNINFESAVDCNYCMKRFPNILELSKHEINHILVDAGPRCDSNRYKTYFKQFYNMYLRAQIQSTYENGDRSYGSDRGDGQDERDVQDERDCNDEEVPLIASGMVPDNSADSVFEVRNEEIYINGRPLTDYDKNERKQYFKTIYVNGVKKKFCPICRHTFKDNWAIDWHYSNNSCQYTCKYCGLKFKYHKDLFPEHLKTHAGQPCNKIFGPSDKKGGKRKKVKLVKRSIIPDANRPRIEPIKLKTLLERKSVDTSQLKAEMAAQSGDPYQAYFCRKCFKVFFKIDEFNFHSQICNGIKTEPGLENDDQRRPTRTCVKEFATYNDSDSESFGSNSLQYSPQVTEDGSGTQSYECGVCSSSFPTRHSRNSHMRIHKSQKIPAEKVTNYLQKNMTINKQESVHKQVQNANLIRKLNEIQKTEPDPDGQVRFATLNPMVAKLVQNNPQLTIRSYSKSAAAAAAAEGYENNPGFWAFNPGEAQSSAPKMGYRCGDCGGRFENKSLLYYHKMNDCVVKRNYECAFCHKKFGSQDHYNIHMLHVHPE